MIEWIHDRCLQWSEEYRRREFSAGWPLFAEMASFDYLHKPEGLSLESHEVSAAVFRMRTTPKMETPCSVITAHYLFVGRPKAKMQMLEMDKFTYWRNLHAGHCYIAARVEQPMQESA